MRYEHRITLLAFVALLSACGSPSVPTLVGHRLTGTVMQQTADGLVPRAGVSVQETSHQRGATTDARGRYTIAGLQDGVAHIRIDFSIFEPIERDIQITSDTVADFQLIPRPLFTLSGRITEMTALGPVPVSGAAVEVVFCSRPNGKYELNDAVTDAEGLYRIHGLCEGPAMVFVNKSGYVYTSPNTPHCDDGHGGECRWATIVGDTRFDQVLIRN
jgi:CarboxypepD_reg-like domain